MPVVRMHVDSAEALADSYGRVAGQVHDAMAELSPLVTEAMTLLDMPGQNPLYGPMPALNETAIGLGDDNADLAWRVDFMKSTDATFLRGSDRFLADMPDIEPSDAADVYNGIAASDAGSKPAPVQLFTKTFDGPGMWNSFRHNILEGNSVVGSLITGRHTPQSTATIVNNAGDVLGRLDNANNEIRSLNPTSFEGANLLARDPGQFFDNQRTFAGGVIDWAADSGKLAAALTIASSPVANDAWHQQTGTNIRSEIANSLRATATAAAKDPDAFAATVVDWEGLEEDPIRWAGNQAPEVVIEVLTAGTAAAPLGSRRAVNIIAETADIADEVPTSIAPVQGARADNAANGSRLNAQLAAREIAGGHAYAKHVIQKAEFPGVRNREQFARVIEEVIANFEDISNLSRGRIAYWRDGIVVIRNSKAADGGTAFVPDAGHAYFEDLG